MMAGLSPSPPSSFSIDRHGLHQAGPDHYCLLADGGLCALQVPQVLADAADQFVEFLVLLPQRADLAGLLPYGLLEPADLLTLSFNDLGRFFGLLFCGGRSADR